MRFLLLTLTALFLLLNLDGSAISLEKQEQPSPRITSVLTYTDHEAISINGDTDFNTTAQVEGWSGNGTKGNPFIISGLRIITDDF
jgi:hypothetical protein